MKKAESSEGQTPSQLITNKIADLGDWRGNMLAQLRKLILDAAPDITEEWKWDTAVWTYNGLVCSAGIFKDHVKLNFFKGAALQDPQGLFNAGLDAKTSRGIHFSEGASLDVSSLSDLVRTAVAYNKSKGSKQ